MITASEILELYPEGWFPMDVDGSIRWYGVQNRALLPIEGIRVSGSLSSTLKKAGYDVTFDRAFGEVIRGCADREETWISSELMAVYEELHHMGIAHSCEVWMNAELAGGVYGNAFGGWFSAESMFHRRTDASKIALYHLVKECARQGFTLFDAQVMSRHLRSLGAFEIRNEAFLQLANAAKLQATVWGRAACSYYRFSED